MQYPEKIAALLASPFPYDSRVLQDTTSSQSIASLTNLIKSACKFRIKWKLVAIVLAAFSILLSITVTYYQRMFINELSKNPSGTVLLIVFATFFVTIVASIFNFLSRILVTREALYFNRQLSSSLYQKKLLLGADSPIYKTIGGTVTLYAQDVAVTSGILEDVFRSIIEAIFPLIIVPFAIKLIFDIPLFWILCILLASTTLTGVMGYRQSWFFRKNKLNAERRLTVVNEWIQNMRILRILGWTKKFEAEIIKKRILETKDRLGMVTNGSTMNSISQVVPGILNIAGILSLIAAKHNAVTPGDVFGLLWIFNAVIGRPIRTLPFIIVQMVDGVTSATRLHKFFELQNEMITNNSDAQENILANKSSKSEAVFNSPCLTVKNLNLSLSGKHLLKDISFEVKTGEFVAIIGEIGSGKSLLLDALLGVVPAQYQSYYINDCDAFSISLPELRQNFAYVSQDGFVMSANLRDNINLSYHSKKELDAQIMTALTLAQFDLVSEKIEAKLDTEIGERGVNLSGGQKQRVNIARSVFKNSQILLLDDCLSAVDVDTEKKLCEQLFCGEWKSKTRILVTQRMSILDKVDRIILLENGRICEQGNFSTLIKTSQKLQKFLKTYTELQKRSLEQN